MHFVVNFLFGYFYSDDDDKNNSSSIIAATAGFPSKSWKGEKRARSGRVKKVNPHLIPRSAPEPTMAKEEGEEDEDHNLTPADAEDLLVRVTPPLILPPNLPPYVNTCSHSLI